MAKTNICHAGYSEPIKESIPKDVPAISHTIDA
jgi:hypothetical protein